MAELGEDEWERMKEELDDSDIRACGGFLPLGRTGLASGTLGQTENGTGLAGGTLDQAENGTGLAGGTLDQAENGTGLAGGALSVRRRACTGLASGTLVEGSDVAAGDFLESAVDAGFGGVLPATRETASGESVTNEPDLDEDVNSSNCFADIGITTNSGVDSGLDKGEIDGNFDGGETADDADCGEAFADALGPQPWEVRPRATVSDAWVRG